MNISEHTIDRFDTIFAQKPISQLIDDGMKQIGVLDVKISNKIGKSYCPILCPIFSF